MVDRKINVFTKVTGAGAVKGLSLNMGALLAVVGLVATALIGLTKAAFDSAKKFLEFEKSVIKINVLLDKTERKAANVKDRLLALRKAVPTAEFDDLSDSVFTLQSELGNVEDAFKLAELAAKAGAATNTDVSQVTTALVTSIKNFNFTTEESIDWLDKYVNAVNSGVVTGDKLSRQLDEASIAMSSLGGTASDTLAVFSALGGALKEEQIKTGLKAINSEVLRNKKGFEEMGISTTDFNQMLVDLEGRDLAQIFGSVEAIQLLDTLIANKEKYGELVTSIENSEGVLAETFSAVEESAGFIFDKAGAKVDDFAIRAGENFANVGASFVTAMDDAGIDEIFEDILEIIEDATPVLIEIARIIGAQIVGALKPAFDFWSKISDKVVIIGGLVIDIAKTLGFIKPETESIAGTVSKVATGWDLINEHIIKALDFFISILGITNELIASVTIIFKGIFKVTDQAAKLANQFTILKNIIDPIREAIKRFEDEAFVKLEDRLKRINIFLAKIFGIQLGGAGGKGGVDQGILERVQGLTGEGLIGDDDGIDGVSDAKERLEIEEEIQGLKIIGLESLRQARIDEDQARRQAEKDQIKADEERIEAEKDAQKRIAKGMSKAIVSALFSGDVAGAFRAVFGGLAEKFLTNAMAKGIGSLLSLIPGVGGFLGAIFGDKGFAEKGVLQLGSGGAFSSVLSKPQLAVIGEKPGVKETAGAFPHNLDGSRVILNDVLPDFPDVVSAIKSSGGSGVTVNINPSISPLLDIEISERNIRGQRMRVNDIAQ